MRLSVCVGLTFTMERSPVLAAVSRAVNTQTDRNHCIRSHCRTRRRISADVSLSMDTSSSTNICVEIQLVHMMTNS